jgi:hypothetical protein
MTSDRDLLNRFARGHSREAFTGLMNRQVNLVYPATLRQTKGNRFKIASLMQLNLP